MTGTTLIDAVRAKLASLVPFRRQVRPAAAASYAPFIDGELQRLAATTRDIVEALQALDPILAGLAEQGGADGRTSSGS
ncbi:hypothetical protein [Sphingomonas desiccabilis]|uniref:Uncharacterized protein n=1 Tax=Sphingomonas desiccabilis TaxID=429134 RepID=A0A4Q2J0M0_9SPHN|nr:hypothetical protein [Sphingomonas desiccabilis]MBB3910153.1 hypothetical protein [Sphingomonas desiccabilis]RXZ34832.1 hypothetical protein EO081_04010 [Sphingomonas desiccabilis]